MEGERHKRRDAAKENPIGQDSTKNEYGEIGEQSQPAAGSAPPRSLGTKGEELGQMADYDRSGQQGQSGTGQADLRIDQPGHVSGASESTGEGFIGAQATGSDNYLQGSESASSAKATEGTNFAPQGRGATEDEEDDGSEGHPS